ncbi:hypothetical protein [Bradyrhizobium australiense]|uniref:Uncharacterized protein n=1 Tax=Bradyrhizobium australiense TaxID=2721161 RepID=A0A7Y4GMV1_9BRAD|nr:hypothetical protein [Bradyrhizobium australiense]NOJ38703.1 hypothetical protein [Bradyrhizobium australiense]
MAWTKSPQSLIDLFDKSVPSGEAIAPKAKPQKRKQLPRSVKGVEHEEVCAVALRI